MKADVSYREAIQKTLDAVRPVSIEEIPLEEAFSRVLARSIQASDNVPPFDRSPYDGYAVFSQDTIDASKENPVTLRILEEIPAGAFPRFPVTPGSASKILTGAPIPEGADAVVMYEKTSFTEKEVTLFAPLGRGDNIVRRGEDIKMGSVLAEKGSRLDAGLLGTLASQGRTRVKVYRRPLVGLISTGSELVSAGMQAGPGQIIDSNCYTFSGTLAGLGCIPVHYGIAEDTVPEIAEKLKKALSECDAVVLTGGVSAGDYDVTPDAMESVGADILFRGCAIKPGMACAYGVFHGKLILGLSGNPASSVTNFSLIARPAILRLCGRADYMPRETIVTLAGGFRKKSPVTRLLRGRLDLSDGTARMLLPGDQGNVVLSSTVGCDLLAIVPAGSGPLEAGMQLKGIVL